MKNDKHVFYNFLESIHPDDKELMLRTLSEWEIMDYCSCEDEYRTITGDEIPENFAAFRPDRVTDHDFPVSEVTQDILAKRLSDIKKAFKANPSLDRLKAMANDTMPKSQVNVIINLGQLQQKANEPEESDDSEESEDEDEEE